MKVVENRNALIKNDFMQFVLEKNRSQFVKGKFAMYSVPEAVWINPPAIKPEEIQIG